MDAAPYEQLIQLLSAILIQINALQTLVGDEAALAGPVAVTELREGLTATEQMTRDVLYLVRDVHSDAPLPELVGTTLAEALSRLVEATAEQWNLSSRVSFSGVNEPGHEAGRTREHTLSSAAERVLFLLARETLYDVQHHTGARRVRLSLNYGPDDVQMSIEDDGLYIGPALVPPASETPPTDTAAPPFLATESLEALATQPRLLIRNDLRCRIERLGGTLEHEQGPERGTRVVARVPYTPTPDGRAEALPIVETAARTVVGNASARPQADAARPSAVSVLVVDGQAVTRAGLRRLLESYANLHVVGEAADGVQAVSETLELGPQVVLLDAQLPNGQSIEALRQIKQLQLNTRVLLLATQDREEYLYETLRAGADGYVLKDIAPDELAQAIATVARGELLIAPQLAGRLLSRVGRQGRGSAPYEALTARELEVLRLLARGLRNKEIAARLFVSERTVNFHLANIYQKLSVSGRTEALSKALEQGLITT
jgi:DNA-binding NarL/FixJ family response regulator